MSKPNRKIYNKTLRTFFPTLGKRFFVGLAILGVLVVIVGVTHRYLFYRSLRLTQAEMLDITQNQEIGKVVPQRIKIWDMMNVEIGMAPFIEGNWVVYEDMAAYLGPSVGIGEEGNMIVYGHNKKKVFSDLRVLRGGEELQIVGSDGEEYAYKVERTVVVNPDEIEMLVETDGHALIMYTCTGFMDSKRFVLRAVPVDGEGRE